VQARAGRSGIDGRSDGELLSASVGDPQAFAVFYRRHVRGVLAFFRRRVADAEVAFDLTAETFAAALEACPRYQPRPEPARGWLYGIAWNKLHEARRRGRVDDAVRRALQMQPIALSDEAVERIEALTGACSPAAQLLDWLPEGQREAVRERVLQDRGYGEIAAALGCSESVVRQRVSRGLRALRRRLEEAGAARREDRGAQHHGPGDGPAARDDRAAADDGHSDDPGGDP
jgi:RNA polymerase sigma factor (sigma-70 family)